MNRELAVSDIERGPAETLALRGAARADADLLWRWANDADVRRFSFVSDPIPWDEHEPWLERKLASAETLFWIACEADGTPVGQIRFDGEALGEAVVGLSVAREQRGRGYGSQILRLAVTRAFEESHWRAINAWIKPDNAASRQAFARGGFQRVGEGQIRGQRAVGYRLPRP